MNKKTQEEIINEFIQTHQNIYDYSLVKYVNAHTKVQIICKKHGIFEQQPRAHKKGQGCPKCKISENWTPSRNQNSFIKRANIVHNNKYDYSKTIYINTNTKIIIICPDHGEFIQLTNSHLNGRGCPKCANNIQKTTDDFIKQATIIHNNKYNYSYSEYKDTSKKIKIICPIHGEFNQRPIQHLMGQGCPKCGIDTMKSKLKRNIHDFIEKCNKIHNNKYKYIDSSYINNKSLIDIECPIHGRFKQKASEHLRGYGCSKCARNKQLTTNEFINKAKNIHGDKYNYSESVYSKSKSKITVICEKHGKFDIYAGYHLSKGGCPSCASSIEQQQIFDYIKTISDDVIENDRRLIAPYELDIVIPSKKLAIEFNGNFYHSYNSLLSENRYKHKLKSDMADKIGISLIQINSHEWKHKKELIKSMILHRIKESDNRLYARKCDIIQINDKTCSDFFKQNHISGHRSGKVNYGIYYNNNLVSCINFIESKQHTWEIIRYATIQNTIVIGGLSKLLSKFINNYKPRIIYTFVDRRYGNGNGYLKAGFKYIKTTNPGYIYLDSNCRPCGSRIKFQKHKLEKILERFDKNLTEAENMFNNGYRRMWDAGHHYMELIIK